MDIKLEKRLNALLAMSQDTSSENEAAIAMKRLHSLLAKHNIELDDLGEENEEIVEDVFTGINWPWKRTVMKAVSELYFCKCYHTKLQKRSYASYHVVGTEVNTKFVISILQNIFKSIENEAKITDNGYKGYVASFRNGAANRIYQRCQELKAQGYDGELEDEDGNNLPVLKNIYETHFYNIEEYLAAEVEGLTIRKSRKTKTNYEGFSAGDRAGSKVQLSRALQGKISPKLLN